MSVVPLIGFSPDLDPATPGVITACDNLIPTTQGFAAANQPVDVGLAALDSACTGAYVGTQLDSTKRIVAGTNAKLWDISGGVWTDRSKAGGYTGLAPWRFCMFGSNVIATNRNARIQQAAPSGAFADIATAPAAGVICSVAGFVMAGNTSDLSGTSGDNPDGWWCSGLYNQAAWTPSQTTQSAYARLVDTPGPITAMRELGNRCVAYKANSMYVGDYQGVPVIWSWTRIPGVIGTPCQEAVVVVDALHYFIGPNDFYVYDGTTPQSIGAPIREWFFANLNSANRFNIRATSDLARNLVYWYFPSTASTGACDMAVVYNIRTKQWGKKTQSIEAIVDYSAGTVTYDGLGALYATYDNLPNISYDSPFWTADNPVPGIILPDHKLYSLTGAPTTCSWTTGDTGDEEGYSFLKRVRPRYRTVPSVANGTNFYRNDLGVASTQDATIAIRKNRFDMRRAAQWHSFKHDSVGPMTVNGVSMDFGGNGSAE